jgi:hypothetical protein
MGHVSGPADEIMRRTMKVGSGALLSRIAPPASKAFGIQTHLPLPPCFFIVLNLDATSEGRFREVETPLQGRLTGPASSESDKDANPNSAI